MELVLSENRKRDQQTITDTSSEKIIPLEKNTKRSRVFIQRKIRSWGGIGMSFARSLTEKIKLTAAFLMLATVHLVMWQYGFQITQDVSIRESFADHAIGPLGTQHQKDIPIMAEKDIIRFRVRCGDTLSGIAAEISAPVKELAAVNGLRVNSILRQNKTLLWWKGHGRRATSSR